jgi:hypothetical protein
MLEKLVYPDGSWIWCRNAPGMELDPAVLEHEINAGFGGINGILAMSSDVLGLLPAERNEPWLLPSVQTFLHLACTPDRLRQFSTHGIWTQFDRYWGGFLASPSYGHGYAVHCMQLMDWPELYTPAIHWLANATFQLLPGQILHRDSPYWFYERYYSPDAVGKVPLEEGCGALNLVCVTEPLKIARLILGLDDSNPNNLRLIPRLPLGWTRVQARQAPVLTPAGMKRVDIEVNANQRGEVTDVKIQPEGAVPGLKVRFGTARNPL